MVHDRWLKKWLFSGLLRAGKRAAAAMSLVQSARLKGHDPYAYLKYVLVRGRRSVPVRLGSCCRFAGHFPAKPTADFQP